MKKILFLGLVIALFNGCVTTVGQTIWDNRVKVYKVVSKGATTFITEEEIKDLKLDKVDTLLQYAYTIDKDSGKKIEEDAVSEASIQQSI